MGGRRDRSRWKDSGTVVIDCFESINCCRCWAFEAWRVMEVFVACVAFKRRFVELRQSVASPLLDYSKKERVASQEEDTVCTAFPNMTL